MNVIFSTWPLCVLSLCSVAALQFSHIPIFLFIQIVRNVSSYKGSTKGPV